MRAGLLAGQQRLAQVQLVNWGTFHGAFSLDVPRKGLLVTGPSGSGKSSLLDALSAVLVQPRWLAFNAAAQEGGTGDRSRSIVSYVRGAYRREADQTTGEVTTAYLREGATWSGIALTYDDTERTTTLVRLFHLARGANAVVDVSSLFILADGPVDLLGLQNHVANGLEQRRLKAAHPDWQLFNHYGQFAARFQRRLGLSSDQAQRLLHKTQSAKNLSSLDTLLREFMLDEPETYALADQAVEQFRELSAAHGSVIDARRQLETLAPLVDLDRELTALGLEQATMQAQLDHLDGHLLSVQIAGARERIEQDTATLTGLDSELERARAAADSAREEYDTWRLRLQGAGGAELSGLLETMEGLRGLLDQRGRDRLRWEARAERAGLALADGAADHELLRARAQEALQAAESTSGAGREAGYGLIQRKHDADDRVRQLRDDLELLLRQGSNLDPKLLRVRELLTERIGCGRADLPFVGELIEVRDDEAGWTGAIERVLHSFARTLLVPDRLYPAVAELVDATHLGTRLVYEKVPDVVTEAAPTASTRSSLPGKVRFDTSPYASWLAVQVARRFDYACVDAPAALARFPRAVTRSGQVKSGSRYEKDDRRQINDRSTWVLGFSTDAKERRLRAELRVATAAAADAAQALQAHEDAGDTVRQRTSALEDLVRLTWEEIDVEAPRRRLAELEHRAAALRAEHTDLADLETGRDRAKQVADGAEDVRRQLQSRRDRLGDGLEQAADALARWEQDKAGRPPVPEHVAQLLAADFRTMGAGRSPEETARKVGAALRDRVAEREQRRQNAVRRTERVMQTFKTGWPVQAAELAIQIDFLPDYLSILGALRADRLPEFEDRFFDLLQNQSRNNIGNLALRINTSRREIRARIDPINRSLLQTEYGPGRYLQVKTDDRRLPEVTDFLGALSRITAGSVEETLGADESPEGRRRAEERFEEMQRLLTRLSSSESADRRWRTQCLDTRLHVKFTAVVQDAEGRPVDYYVGSGGLSGGERQKLVVFCLAAALRYQLAPEGSDLPSYGLVVLDEAFDKTDPEFTRAGLEVFRVFGFQLLLATPMKMLQTLEDYVGGAALVQHREGQGSRLESITFEDAPEGRPGEMTSGLAEAVAVAHTGDSGTLW